MALLAALARSYTPRRVARPKTMATGDSDGRSPTARPASGDEQARSDAQTAGVDAILDDLEAVVRRLEAGDLPLEEALAQFEQGVHLARRGGRLLDAVEQRVERLLADRDETVPFDQEEEG